MVFVNGNKTKYPLRLSHLAVLLLASGVSQGEEPARNAAFVEGDRVVLLGGTFIERMQDADYLETELTRRMVDRSVTFRNLGWSGDNVAGVSRAVFGTPEQGFVRLIKDIKASQPTALVICYGSNEAHAGEAGLAPFITQANRLLDTLEPLQVRITLLAPPSQEKMPAPLPSPAKYNRQLAQYVEALRTIATKRGHHFVAMEPVQERARDLAGESRGEPGQGDQQALERLTENGLHFGDLGYWALAPNITRALGVNDRDKSWSIGLDVTTKMNRTRGVKIGELTFSADGVSFAAVSEVLPRPRYPGSSGSERNVSKGSRVLTIAGLKPGNYTLKVNGKAMASASSLEWAAGFRLRGDWEQTQVEQLRQRIVAKNKLYFHRYRPQNETYLFLFRKHEQGNNAVEIPKFDPLVAELEDEIRKLKKPRSHRFRLSLQK